MVEFDNAGKGSQKGWEQKDVAKHYRYSGNS